MAHINDMQQPERVTMAGRVWPSQVVVGTAAMFFAACPVPAKAAVQATSVIPASGAESTGAYKRAIAWGILKARVIRWSALDHDWDGNDGEPPSEVVCENAKAFIACASRLGAPVPSPFISGDGEIGFRWAKGNDFASVSFVDDHVIAFVRDGSRKQSLDQVFRADDKDLLALVASLVAFA